MITLATFAASLLASTPMALASSPFYDSIYLGATGGTLGGGPELGYHQPNALLGARFDADFMSIDRGFNSDGIHYAGTANISTEGATFDLYPFHNGFRVSIGLRNNDNDIDVVATAEKPVTIKIPGSTITIPGKKPKTVKIPATSMTFQPDQIGYIDGEVSWAPVAPYIGVGYSGRIYSNLHLSIDAGVLYQGQGSLELEAITPLSKIPAAQPYIDHELAVVNAKVHEYLHDGDFYPVVQVGLTWNF